MAYDETKYVNEEGLKQWQELKPTLKNSFANLPYLLDGDKVICESQAIILHIVHKANRLDLLGSSDE